MNESKVLAIMGSGGAGKTTTGIKLAVELSRKKRNVIIVFCDPFTPVLPFVLPAGTVYDTSLGELLTSPSLTQESILTACIPVESSEYISVLGYKSRESLMTYPKITREKTVDFFVMLRHLADFVIIDSAGVFEADVTSIVAIEMADRVLRLGTANLNSISYYQTHEPMLADNRFKSDTHLKALSNVRSGQEWEAVSQQYRGVQYVLPHNAELERQYDEVTLFETLNKKESQPYTTEIKRMTAEIFGIHYEPAKATPAVPVKPSGKAKTKHSVSLKLPFGNRKGEF